MIRFLGDDDPDDVEVERCGNCGREVPAGELRDDGYCRSCGDSAWTQTCPRCGATAISAETRDNPKGYHTHASGTITIWECEGCGFRSRFQHDWRWE